jgi:hypothetical protein
MQTLVGPCSSKLMSLSTPSPSLLSQPMVHLSEQTALCCHVNMGIIITIWYLSEKQSSPDHVQAVDPIPSPCLVLLTDPSIHLP